MKAVLNKEDVIEGIQKAYSIIPSKAGAYLRSMWLSTKKDSIAIMATDASIEFTGCYKAQTEDEHILGIPSRSFVELLRRFSPGDITIRLEEEKRMLCIEQGKSVFHLPISDPMWFQPFSVFPEEKIAIWHGASFLDIIEKAVYCISDDEQIEGINCLYVKPVDNGIEFCGLNGHQLAVVHIEENSLKDILPQEGILVHKRYLIELKKLLQIGDIELSICDKRLFIRTLDKQECITLPLHVCAYPEYTHFLKMIDTEDIAKLVIDRKNMIEALNRILIFNTEGNRCVYFTLSPNEVQLSVQGYEVGNGVVSVDAMYKGTIDSIAFPTKNLLEILTKYISDTVTLCFTSLEGPCAVLGDNDPGYTVIIMPMKIAETH